MSEKAALRLSVVMGSDLLEVMTQLVPQFPASSRRLRPLSFSASCRSASPRRCCLPARAGVPTAAGDAAEHPRGNMGYVLVKPPRPDSFVLALPYIQDDGTVDYEPSTLTSGACRAQRPCARPSRATRTDSTPLTMPPMRSRSAHRSLSERKADIGRLARCALRDAGGQPLHTHVSFVPSEPCPSPGFHVEEEDGPAPVPRWRRRRAAADVPHSVHYDSTEVLGIPWLAPEADDRHAEDDDAPLLESFETTAPIASDPGASKASAPCGRCNPLPRRAPCISRGWYQGVRCASCEARKPREPREGARLDRAYSREYRSPNANTKSASATRKQDVSARAGGYCSKAGLQSARQRPEDWPASTAG